VIRKAWRTVWTGLPHEPAIVIAPTRGRALARALLNLHEAGYAARWQDLRCCRAPEYDHWAEGQGERRLSVCMAEKWVAMKAAEINAGTKS
jgi:hypothetical protein